MPAGRGEEPDSEGVLLERVGTRSRPRLVVLITIVVVGLIGALWLKPWDHDERLAAVPSSPAAAQASTGAAASAQSAVDRPDFLASLCQPPNGWRMLTEVAEAGVETRSVIPGFPEAAADPTDEIVPITEVTGTRLDAVGVCVPRSPVVSATSQLRQVVLWKVDPDGVAHEVLRPTVVYPDLYDIGEAYYTPPEGEGESWPAGQYVFEIRRIEGPESHWMGISYAPAP